MRRKKLNDRLRIIVSWSFIISYIWDKMYNNISDSKKGISLKMLNTYILFCIDFSLVVQQHSVYIFFCLHCFSSRRLNKDKSNDCYVIIFIHVFLFFLYWRQESIIVKKRDLVENFFSSFSPNVSCVDSEEGRRYLLFSIWLHLLRNEKW